MPQEIQRPVHLCLVSDQVVPNLIPACDEQLRPSEMILLTSRGKAAQAKNLAKALAARNVQCSNWEIDNPWDVEHIRSRLNKLVSERRNDNMVLNVTGGTKIMAFAAQEVFQREGLPIFYVHPDKNQLVWLSHQRESVTVSEQISIEDFIGVHGYSVKKCSRDPLSQNLRDLCEEIVLKFNVFSNALGVMNSLAMKAKDHPEILSPEIENRHRSDKSFQELVRLFFDEKLIHIQGNCLKFADQAARDFVNGGWLEHYIYATINRLGLQFNLQDCAMNVVVASPTGSRNEVDVVFLVNNRLHLIECKTKQFRGHKNVENGEGSGAETLYKMDFLRDLGGLQTRSMLISYQKVPWNDKQRAEDLGIDTLVGPIMHKLDELLLEWIKPK